MIDILDLENYALTGHVSVYNEDSLTAQHLLIKTARKTKECTTLFSNLADGILTANLIVKDVDYNTELEELSVLEQKAIQFNKTDPATTRYYFLFNENGKSQIELAGNICRIINEVYNYIPEIITALAGFDVPEQKLKDLTVHIDNCYGDIYDDCTMTVLELAGNTANRVNDYITAVNMLEDIVKTINSIEYRIQYDWADEMITTNAKDNGNQELEL